MTTARSIIEHGRMHPLQWVAVVITIGLNALDGFDVLASAFAAPGIAKEWHVSREALGIVLSMELWGMVGGSLLLGGLADIAGRRRTTLLCLCIMTLGMAMATTATSPQNLSLWRLVTGFGIGGMLAALNALAAELSNLKHRSLAMAIMVIGYPVGGTVGGLIVQQLLHGQSWRAVFNLGAVVSAAFIPLVVLFIPETPAFLDQKRPAGALAAINRILTRFRLPQLDALAPHAPEQARASVLDILKPGLIGTTTMLTLGYFFHAISFYFILKWAPKIIADLGHSPSEAAGVLTAANIGGAIGGALFGVFMHRFGIKRPMLAALVGSVAGITLFGLHDQTTTLLVWSIAASLGMVFANAAIVGFYASFAAGFPTHVRATGTGFALSLGRFGGALSPILAGYLFKAQLGLPMVALVMSGGSAVAFVLLARFRLQLR
ncbi:MFS transporter [Novosphingobium sp.]|uniref:MFS transporter n=1 Tax=Novosphingobium sp. TaxID=1874826 RepID=UPI0033416C60